MIPNYKILTSKSVLDIEDHLSMEDDVMALWEEQNSLLPNAEAYIVHIFEDSYYMDEEYFSTDDIRKAMERLAIKDGVDLVRFENGNMGFVAYYSGHENALEFITEFIPNEEKVKQEIEKENILEFDSTEECLHYFNTYDYQNFKTIEDLINYQCYYGFNIGEKRYHIDFDSAFCVYF